MRKEMLEIKKEVDDAFDRVFNGNTRINEGIEDDYCSKETLDYFVKLYNGEPEALRRLEGIKTILKTLDLDIEETF